MRKTAHLASIALTGLLSFTLQPRLAAACGGTFCDSGPTAMPVDQSGENILFVMSPGYVEAHVQIQYEGDAERFAWIVPMQGIPEVTVGSQQLFTNLLNATVPNVGYTTSFDDCGDFGSGANGGSGNVGSGGSGGTGRTGGGGGGPNVVFSKTVGAFEVTALQGGTAQEVVDWLSMNGYQNIPAAPSLLEDYVARGFVFVAIKLTADADVNEIHPLTFRYAGDEPCVPIKLTAVAATENMGVRTFFLGDDRFMPTNYKHIVPNPVRLDWLNFGSNYESWVTRSVDSPVSNGHGFVTEYAGSSGVVFTGDLYQPAWNAGAFTSIAADQVVDTLTSQNLMYCYPGYCEYYHPLLRSILSAHLPPPQGVLDDDFYSCVSCFADQLDPNAWDPAAFATDLDERLIKPGKHAKDVLSLYPVLTRMYTTLSPAEMTEDPIFVAAPGLPSVGPMGTATQRITCDSQSGMTLPDGRQVGLPSGGGWPTFDSNMPWAERIEEYTDKGELIVLVDNKDQIDAQLKAYNAGEDWPPAGSGGSTGFGGGNAGGNAGTNPWGNTWGGNSNLNGDASDSTTGCACSVPGSSSSETAPLAAALGLGLLGGVLGRRRKRR